MQAKVTAHTESYHRIRIALTPTPKKNQKIVGTMVQVLHKL